MCETVIERLGTGPHLATLAIFFARLGTMPKAPVEMKPKCEFYLAKNGYVSADKVQSPSPPHFVLASQAAS